MLELKNISFTAENKKIIDNVSLTVNDGEILLFTGPNGGGKTTLAKIIMGIVTPTEGKIILDGEDITSLSITERANIGIGYAFQAPARFKGLTVKRLLKIACGDDFSEDCCCDLLSKVGLCQKEYLNRALDSSLSGGELKRIEVASILARKLKVAIYDEPEAGIDLWSFNMLVDTFASQKGKGSTVIISHQERILNIADKIIVIADGKIENVGRGSDIMPSLLEGATCKTLTDKM
jgi:Fe-S cluster assembly ATP-binding protein